MKLLNFAITLVTLVLTPSTLYAASLCTSNEEIIWSCTLRNKIYSVCASRQLNKKTGYMQYRVAKNNKIEFLFPEEKMHPSGKFSFALLPKGAMLSFGNASYQYEMFESLMGEPSFSVAKNGKLVLDVQCDSGSYTLTNTDVQKLLSGAGVVE